MHEQFIRHTWAQQLPKTLLLGCVRFASQRIQNLRGAGDASKIWLVGLKFIDAKLIGCLGRQDKIGLEIGGAGSL